jgi:hypothetical protein
VSVDEGPDWSLVEFAKQVAAIPRRISEAGGDIGTVNPTDEKNKGPTVPEGDHKKEVITAPSETSPVVDDTRSVAPTPSIRTDSASQRGASRIRQQRTPDEIAKVIMETLQTIDRCPDRGFVVTVYGSNPWNAMLTIRPEAGPSIDRTFWSSRVQDIGVQLRADFDVV